MHVHEWGSRDDPPVLFWHALGPDASGADLAPVAPPTNEPPHVEHNRAHIERFRAAVPQAEVRWPPGAGHGLIEDLGPPLGDEIAAWLVEHGL